MGSERVRSGSVCCSSGLQNWPKSVHGSSVGGSDTGDVEDVFGFFTSRRKLLLLLNAGWLLPGSINSAERDERVRWIKRRWVLHQVCGVRPVLCVGV